MILSMKNIIITSILISFLTSCADNNSSHEIENQSSPLEIHTDVSSNSYTPLGVGGGGAMSGVAISPYAELWFVGTDMGTLLEVLIKVRVGMRLTIIKRLSTVILPKQ